MYAKMVSIGIFWNRNAKVKIFNIHYMFIYLKIVAKNVKDVKMIIQIIVQYVL